MVKAVILAAGRGSRLGVLTNDRPKCMVELWGEPLLNWQIEALRGAGIEDITIVRGYMAEKIDVPGVSYLENKRWAETNMVATLMEARETLENGPTIVSYSDIVYTSEAVKALLTGSGNIRITYDPNWRKLWEMRFEDPLSDAETFKRDKNTGRLLEIGNRPSSYDEVQGQYMGLLYFEPPGWMRIQQYLDTISDQEKNKIDVTKLLNCLMIHNNIQTIMAPFPWFEIDSLRDLEVAKSNNLATAQ